MIVYRFSPGATGFFLTGPLGPPGNIRPGELGFGFFGIGCFLIGAMIITSL
jgi:hypothetical protein